MSMHLHRIDPVPAETARVARAAFRKGNLYLRIRDELGSLYEDEQFADLFARRGQPAEARLPSRIGLRVSISGRSRRLGKLSMRSAAASTGSMRWD